MLACAGLRPGPDFNLAPTPTKRVVVSATRIATPIAQIGSSVTVVTAADIEARQQRVLPDALATVPGLIVEQTGGLGGQTSIFMRGTNSNHTKVMLDGIDIADPSTPQRRRRHRQVPAGDIARVEVLRGPQSGLYGSDAIGGVINIVTKAGEGPLKLTARRKAAASTPSTSAPPVSGSEGGFHYVLTLDHVHAGATPVTPLSLLLPGEKRNDDFMTACRPRPSWAMTWPTISIWAWWRITHNQPGQDHRRWLQPMHLHWLSLAHPDPHRDLAI